MWKNIFKIMKCINYFFFFLYSGEQKYMFHPHSATELKCPEGVFHYAEKMLIKKTGRIIRRALKRQKLKCKEK